MQIRILNKDDIECWRDLRIEALKNHPEAFASSYEEEVKNTETDWEKNLKNNDIFGVFINGLLVGSVGFSILNKIKTKHIGILYAMYIKPEFRKRNIADSLLIKVINHAKLYVTQIHLACVTTNLGAFHLYEKHGFKVYGISPYALKVNNKFFDEYLMVLQFKLDSNVS